jgi:putative methyltransferase
MEVVLGQFEGVTTIRPLPLAAGLLVATARLRPELADVSFDILTRRIDPEAQADRIGTPAVLGLSLYTWNERYALAVAEVVKRRSPRTLIVVGGPSVPRPTLVSRAPHEPPGEALEAWLSTHRAVDVAVVGEGEATFADLLVHLRQAPDDHPVSVPIAGTVVRHGTTFVHGPPRPRLAAEAFDSTGSPYLDGTFDRFLESGEHGGDAPLACVFETNRGCPFSCTFCDWGQATESKVNELPLERVAAELRWAAVRGIPYAYFIDANFGIRRRDPAIIATLTDLFAETGAPRFVYFHLTKNATEKNLGNVLALKRAGIGTQVSLSMQDFDPGVLAAIRRDNIHPERALALRAACHREGLPTTNELLLGLPGQTLASVRRGVTQALTPFPGDSFFLYPTRLLPNAELASPAEVARHGLVTVEVPLLPLDPSRPHPLPERERIVVATSTLPAADWREAFVFGHALAAVHDQQLAPTTLHLLAWHLEVEVPRFIDALLDHAAGLRALLERFADATLAAEATTLVVRELGPRRLDPIEGAVAHVLIDPDGFFAAVSKAARAVVSSAQHALVTDAVAFDRATFARHRATAEMHTAEYDWLDYLARAGERPAPVPRITSFRCEAIAPLPLEAHHAWFVANGWAKAARRGIHRQGAEGAESLI